MSTLPKEEFCILAEIKKRTLQYCKTIEFEDPSIDVNDREQFYTRTAPGNCAATYNLISPMAPQHICEYSKGSGGELENKGKVKAKMRALRSSSAMTFNILSNESCVIEHPVKCSHLSKGKYDIEYEYQLHTLRRSAAGNPANLDALLTHHNGNEVIACEMKKLEWLSMPSKTTYPDGSRRVLKEAYLKAENYKYFERNSEQAQSFANLAAQINEQCNNSRYDSAQMFKHSMALYNGVLENSFGAINKLTLLNCVWEPSFNVPDSISKKLKEEHEGRDMFLQMIDSIRTAFDKESVEFSVEYLTAKDLILFLRKTDEELNYLERYM